MKDILILTASVLLAVCVVSGFLAPQNSDAFVSSLGPASRPPQTWPGLAHGSSGSVSLAAMRNTLGTKGLLAYGMGFGMLMALTRSVVSAQRVSRRAEEKGLAVQEKYDLSKTYMANMPRTILDEGTLQKLLSTIDKKDWDTPPEDSYLFMLKMYAETYGEGKATKMGWWDYWYMRVNAVEAGEFPSGAELEDIRSYELNLWRKGITPMWLPGPSQLFPTNMTYKFRGAEPFAGDQVQTPVNGGKLSRDFVKAWAFYRDGLKPWQRGLEIGMAHGYLIIGPFTSLGQLRNTPEAATVGMLAGIVVIGMFTCGGLIFGKTIKPTVFDKEGDEPAAGYNELVQWHGAGGIGGAAFAHALISVFGS